MTITTPRSSPLNRSSPCASTKRFSLQRLVVMVLLSSSPASCARNYATPDVRPLITSLRSITHKTSVIDEATSLQVSYTTCCVSERAAAL